MAGARRKKQHWGSSAIPEGWETEKEQNLANLLALEELVEGSTENPVAFLEGWLRPLLREGLSMERACEVVIESVSRPN